MDLPESKKPGVPAYMVSFGDMVTLLLTFFILLVALADTQEAGLVAAGRGPIVQHILSVGRPGILAGRLQEHRRRYKRDNWWIPNQEGDPDQLELVIDRLERELRLRFTADEADIHYEQDRLILRLPGRVVISNGGGELLDPALREQLASVAGLLASRPQRQLRISGDVPVMDSPMVELSDSARTGRVVYQYLKRWHGVREGQMSLWGWGSSRLRLPSSPRDGRNRTLTLELYDPPQAHPAAHEENADGR
ncbi:MAG: flagellar motor protein MotB [Planctomycetota bacterium]|jgi:chemotaxis protein MotB